jgi:very-short-patch-repair endonuclease
MQPAHLERRRALRRQHTEAERALWRAVRSRALGAKFRRQHAIGPYVVDLYCAAVRVVIEIDGGHHFDADRLAYDAARTAWLEARGLHVLRFTNRDVADRIDDVIAVIAARVGPSP